MPFIFNGQTYNLPGVYGIIEVINSAGATLPDFNIGLLIADSIKGAPYTSSAKASEMLLPYSDLNALANDYGYGHLYEMFKQAKSQGAGTIFVLNAQANTQAKGTLMDAGLTPAASVVMKASPKNYGIFGNDGQISIIDSQSDDLIAGGAIINTGVATSATSTTIVDSTKTWTIDALKAKWVKIESGLGNGQTRKITANTATALTVAAWSIIPDTTSIFKIYEPKYTVTITGTKNEKVVVSDIINGAQIIWINSIEGVSINTQFDLYNSVDGKVGTYTIIGYDSNYNSTKKGYKILTAEVINNGNSTTANYARILNLDTDKAATITFSLPEYTLDGFITKMNQSQDEYIFEAATSATLPPAIITSTTLANLSTPTKGTNPPANTSDYTNIANNFPDWAREFRSTNKVNIREILLGTPDSSVHAVYKQLATQMADNINKKPIVIVAGTDYVTTTSALVSYAKAINKGTFSLWAGGIDRLPAYLSTAPQIFGIRLANPIIKKLTNVLINCAKPEREWTYQEQVLLNKNGVGIFVAKDTGYRVIQGITTYQDQSYSWNKQDNDTYLIRQRDLADYFHIGVLQGMERDNIGPNDVSKEELSTYLVATAQNYLQQGYIIDYKVSSIKAVSSGWIIEHDLFLPEDRDFIGIITRINI